MYYSTTTGQIVDTLTEAIKMTVFDLIHYRVLNLWKHLPH